MNTNFRFYSNVSYNLNEVTAPSLFISQNSIHTILRASSKYGSVCLLVKTSSLLTSRTCMCVIFELRQLDCPSEGQQITREELDPRSLHTDINQRHTSRANYVGWYGAIVDEHLE
jgi:hypothetical protein